MEKIDEPIPDPIAKQKILKARAEGATVEWDDEGLWVAKYPDGTWDFIEREGWSICGHCSYPFEVQDHKGRCPKCKALGHHDCVFECRLCFFYPVKYEVIE